MPHSLYNGHIRRKEIIIRQMQAKGMIVDTGEPINPNQVLPDEVLYLYISSHLIPTNARWAEGSEVMMLNDPNLLVNTYASYQQQHASPQSSRLAINNNHANSNNKFAVSGYPTVAAMVPGNLGEVESSIYLANSQPR
mmetsp:Transcript_3465/g.5895  ORF Transcript_3465/g.5895 Transcript_3465/m.5895 type:complete len:138 (-) Transcript_3465:567-980(-)